jgi:hypothetical protein
VQCCYCSCSVTQEGKKKNQGEGTGKNPFKMKAWPDQKREENMFMQCDEGDGRPSLPPRGRRRTEERGGGVGGLCEGQNSPRILLGWVGLLQP